MQKTIIKEGAKQEEQLPGEVNSTNGVGDRTEYNLK